MLRRRRFETLPFPLSHELVVFGGARPGRRVGWQASRPLRNIVADPVGELLVDGAAGAEAQREERKRREQCKVKRGWRHRDVASCSIERTQMGNVSTAKRDNSEFSNCRYYNTAFGLSPAIPCFQPGSLRSDRIRRCARLTSSRGSDAMPRHTGPNNPANISQGPGTRFEARNRSGRAFMLVRTKLLSLAAAGLAIASAAAAAQAQETVKIGLILPMTGGQAS